MNTTPLAQQDYLDAFIKTAQYLAGLTTRQDPWDEAGKALAAFFGATFCVFVQRGVDGEITGHHWNSPEDFDRKRIELENREVFTEVLESSFLLSRHVLTPEPLSLSFLPITQNNQVTDVLLVGQRAFEPISKELLNVYLAVARLIGTTAERLTSALDLRKHRDHLDDLVKERTAALTKANEQLQQEIVERKQVEGRLRESEAEKRAILNGMTTSVRFVNRNYKIIWINKAGLASVNKTLEEVIGHRCFEFWGDDPKKPCRDCPASRVFKSGQPAHSVRHLAGGVVWDFRAEPVFDEQGKMEGLVEIITDITDKTRLEAALEHARKMDGIATLAGGVAHEFNNALMGIMGSLDLLRLDLPAKGTPSKCLDFMEDAGHRMARLTDQLLAYAQGGKYQTKRLGFNDFLMEAIPIVKHSLKPTVRLETVLPKDVSSVEADPTQVQMLLSAVLSNANDAIEGEGLVRITTQNQEISDSVTGPFDCKPGRYVALTIEDNGKGMDEKTRSAIFEPFFTTKFQGRGMGMAAVYGVVRNHGGYIHVDSGPGKGTVVRIFLPALPEETEKATNSGDV